ncbi:probable G-protein coupled receptor 139 [Chiloscyllium plagiosum]|uniref:probable G-protein coupled receptor 139 n=1 Tax=Chiloscyllium plagiosum TaxID=36176 RepID=UPI001CB827B1|nr:probable G-protein coupled receptor 139 [Chiloscyllium plagiosum]
MAIIILARLSRCITSYLVAIAAADFLVIITAVILNRIGRIFFSYSVLSTTHGCTITAVLVYVSRDGSVWLTVAFTIDRFVAICCQNLKTRYCNEKTAALVIGMVSSLSCIKNIPILFMYKPLYSLDGVSWFCDIRSVFYTSLVWKSYDWLDRILTPFLPFLLILLLNTLTIRYILAVSATRKRLRGTESGSDSEIANRKRSIILLFAISLSFLLLWVTYVIHFIYIKVRAEGYFNTLDFTDPQYILQETKKILQLLSSCNNVFIYAVSQTKFRKELKYLMLFPFTTVIGRFKW